MHQPNILCILNKVNLMALNSLCRIRIITLCGGAMPTHCIQALGYLHSRSLKDHAIDSLACSIHLSLGYENLVPKDSTRITYRIGPCTRISLLPHKRHIVTFLNTVYREAWRRLEPCNHYPIQVLLPH